MNIAFFGTGEFSTNILKKIIINPKIEVKLVVSQPDKAVGRKKIITPTPIKIFAQEQDIKVLQPTKLKNNIDFFEQLKGLDFIVVVAYGKIVPIEVLNAPKYGCINIHGSLLPKYRGASPIQEAIKNGDKNTGLTIMYMSEGMDEGDILAVQNVEIDNMDNSLDIFEKFEEIGPNLLIDTLEKIIKGQIQGQIQDNSKATYCSKITKEDGEINFRNENSYEIYNKYRAYISWPGIFTFYKGKKLNIEECCFSNLGDFEKNFSGQLIPGKTVKIDKKNIGIVCKDKKILILQKVKLEGKKSMDIMSFVNGEKDFLNYQF